MFVHYPGLPTVLCPQARRVGAPPDGVGRQCRLSTRIACAACRTPPRRSSPRRSRGPASPAGLPWMMTKMFQRARAARCHFRVQQSRSRRWSTPQQGRWRCACGPWHDTPLCLSQTPSRRYRQSSSKSPDCSGPPLPSSWWAPGFCIHRRHWTDCPSGSPPSVSSGQAMAVRSGKIKRKENLGN